MIRAIAIMLDVWSSAGNVSEMQYALWISVAVICLSFVKEWK